MKAKRPIRTGKLAPLFYSVWANRGKYGTFYTVTFDRVYLHRHPKTGAKEFRYTKSFTLADLVLIATAADLAFDFINHYQLLKNLKQHQPRFVDHAKLKKPPP